MCLAVRYDNFCVAYVDLSSSLDSLAMMFAGIGVICVAVAVIFYSHINRERDKILQELTARGEKLSPVEIKRLGDRSPTFRYMI